MKNKILIFTCIIVILASTASANVLKGLRYYEDIVLAKIDDSEKLIPLEIWKGEKSHAANVIKSSNESLKYISALKRAGFTEALILSGRSRAKTPEGHIVASSLTIWMKNGGYMLHGTRYKLSELKKFCRVQ